MTSLQIVLVVVALLSLLAETAVLRRQLRRAENDTAQAIAELRTQVHVHPIVRLYDHEPAVARVLAGETDASERRGTS